MSTLEADQIAMAPAVRRNGVRWREIANHLAIFFGLVGVWELTSHLGIADPLLFPRPSHIVLSLWLIYVTEGNVWEHLYATFAAAISGCVIGSVLGIGLAVGAALSNNFREYLKPYIILIEATPRLAIGPLLIAWLGFGFTSKVGLAALVCFFAPFVNTLTGLLSVDEDALEMMRSMRASKLQTFWKLMVPSAMPLVMAGLKLAVGSAFAGALVAEFVSASEGMGVLMWRYTYALNMASAFACLLSIAAFGYLMFVISEAADHRIIFWRSDELMQKRSRKQAALWNNR